ncbi:MAG: bifunctional serine/threonine-protein kinase/formylglycine-generating enzyme family protein [Polyangiaceae bacterium]
MAIELAPGQTLYGRYRLDRRLDEGGMAVVWAGTQLSTGREVALKVLKAEAAQDSATRRRMLREARAACAVRHPNVLAVHDVIELDDGSPVLVMDLLRGESLREHLARKGPLSLDATIALLMPVIAAVGTAHAAGIVHRDLKPENIYLAQQGGLTTVKVLDFGIAKVSTASNVASQVNALTNAGTMLGTPYYMAPEQIVGEGIDHRADVWSLGVIVYECLVGVRPTEADNIGKILKRVLTNEIEPLSERAPTLPKEVTGLVDRMLSQNPSARPFSMREVGEALLPFAPAGTTLGEILPPATEILSEDDLSGKVRLPREVTDTRPVISGPPKADSDPRPAGRTEELAATLVAPTNPALVSRSLPSRRPPAPAGRPSREREDDAEDSGPPRRRWAVAAGLLVGVFGLASAGYTLFIHRPGRPPYHPATAQVEPSGDCPPGMALVPGGAFRMGSEDGKDDERPTHPVTVAPLCMDVLEVTAMDYQECSQRGGCRPPESTVKWAGLEGGVRDRESVYCIGTQNDAVHAGFPMNCVSWSDADAYCKVLGKRLPTEAEWEYAAAGGGEQRRFPWGKEPPGPTLLNVCDRSCVAKVGGGVVGQRPIYDQDDGYSDLAPGGKYPPGDARWGMHDMAGNVWEWTASPYCTYPEHDCTSPHKVFRGGGWGASLLTNLRTSVRMWSAPSHRYNDVGFRCVKDR